MLTELILEGLVATLLAVTVGYCFVLNRRLSTLRNGQDGLLEVVRTLNMATEQARASVRELHDTGETTGERLSEKVARAQVIADELSLIVESGNNLADRLTTGATERRSPPVRTASTRRFRVWKVFPTPGRLRSLRSRMTTQGLWLNCGRHCGRYDSE